MSNELARDLRNPYYKGAHRENISPAQEQKLALKAWLERGYKEALSGVFRYTDEGVLAVAGKDALVMLRRGRRLGREARARG
jgi:hypothetical protein